MFKTVSSLFWIGLLLVVIGLNSGCQEKATQKSLNKLCLKDLKKYFQFYPLERLEHKFFTDHRGRNILKWEHIKLKSYKELDASATLSTYQLLYQFQNAQGQRIDLHNTPKTGGVSLSKPNHATYELECKIFWNSFKGTKIDSKLSIHMVNLEKDDRLERILYSK